MMYQKHHPNRWRLVERIILGGSGAGDTISNDDDDECCICFTDPGTLLVGCRPSLNRVCSGTSSDAGQGHRVCSSCLRRSLRIVVGDVTTKEHLICGCVSADDRSTLGALAAAADDALQRLTADESLAAEQQAELDEDIMQTKVSWGLSTSEPLPQGIYQQKLMEWFGKLDMHDMADLFIACTHPACPPSNYMLKTDFERHRQHRGTAVWTCRAGHVNTFLPSDEDIIAMNRSLLSHPEYYVTECDSDDLQLRRYRLCPGCSQEGLLLLAVHDGACKHWPGIDSLHKHSFCFRCTRAWGSECQHGENCPDPGVQQVRALRDRVSGFRLQIGYVDARQYIRWLNNRPGVSCPPTIFREPQGELPGRDRQAQLGMVDKAALLREMRKGTE